MPTGEVFSFFGLVHSARDYYFYGMNGKSGVRLLSHGSSIAGRVYTQIKEPALKRARDSLALTAIDVPIALEERQLSAGHCHLDADDAPIR